MRNHVHTQNWRRDPLADALARKALHGLKGGARGRLLASAPEWSATDVVCTSGPRDRSFEEAHPHISVALVLAGSFSYRSEQHGQVMTPDLGLRQLGFTIDRIAPSRRSSSLVARARLLVDQQGSCEELALELIHQRQFEGGVRYRFHEFLSGELVGNSGGEVWLQLISNL